MEHRQGKRKFLFRTHAVEDKMTIFRGSSPRFFILVLGALVLFNVWITTSCIQVSRIDFEADRSKANTGTAEFHKLFNEGRFEGIYDLTDEHARRSKSKEGLISMLAALKKVRGNVAASELVDSKVETRAAYREVHLLFKTKFQNSEVREKFVWYVSNEKAGLFSYESE